MSSDTPEELDKIHVYVYRERDFPTGQIRWRVSDHQPDHMLFDQCKTTVWHSQKSVDELQTRIDELEALLDEADLCFTARFFRKETNKHEDELGKKIRAALSTHKGGEG